MSGGRWDYMQIRLAEEIYGWDMNCHYGDDGFKQSKKAARKDPLEDAELSELVWDVFIVLHSYDWYASGDNCEETYRADVQRFKDKWMKKTQKERVKRQVDRELELARESLYKSLGIEEE